MEELLQNASNEHRTVYYATQLKIMDISQSLRTMNLHLTQNELKSLTFETFEVYYMLQTIFNESKIPHIYQLIQHLNTNYNSIIALLLERSTKLVKNQEMAKSLVSENNTEKVDSLRSTNDAEGIYLKQIKKNRLGGVHLYNNNYSKYLQDHRILQQIKCEKQQRLDKNKEDIFRYSVLAELEHTTDVEQNPAKNDDIALYILQSKNKNSMLNYVSYEPELQQIMAFFENSQSEATTFLAKEDKNSKNGEGQFSFADIQREVQLKNAGFKKQVTEKLSHFVSVYRQKLKKVQQYIIQHEQRQKLLLDKNKGVAQAVQTNLGFDEYIKRIQAQSKQLSAKCSALESVKRQELTHIKNEKALYDQIELKDGEIQRLNYQNKDFEESLERVNKLLREQKTKKTIVSFKENQILTTQKTIQRQMEKDQVQIANQKSNVVGQQTMMDEISSMGSSSKLRKTSNMNRSWRSRPQSEDMPLKDAQIMEEGLSRYEKKKTVKYHVVEDRNDNDSRMQYSAKHSSRQKQTEKEDQMTNLTQQIGQKRLKTNNNIIIQNPIDTNQQNKGQFIPLPIKQNNKIGNPQRTVQRQNAVKKKTPVFQSQKLQKKQLMLAVQKQKDHLSQSKRGNINLPDHGNQRIENKKEDILCKPKKSIQAQKDISKRNSLQKVSKQMPKTNQNILLLAKDTQGLDLIPSSVNILKSPKIQIKDKVLIDKQQRLTPSRDKKQHVKYKIYQVTEDEGEQVQQSLSHIQRSVKSLYPESVQKLQLQSMQKQNQRHYKTKSSNKWNYNHLYSITILPFNSHNQRVNLQNTDSTNGQHRSQLIEWRDKVEGDVKKDKKQIRQNILKLFESLPKLQGKQHQAKRAKLQICKKRLMNNFKTNIISQEQLQQIMFIFKYKSSNGPVPDSSINYPNTTDTISLPKIQQFQNQYLKGSLKEIKNMKERSAFISQNETINSKKYVDSQFEQQLSDLIRSQSNYTHFPSKFHSMHRNCAEGPVCTHILKYFETLMKYFQEKGRKNQKQSAIQHVENIGRRNVVEIETCQLQRRGINRSQQHLQNNKENFGRSFVKKAGSHYRVNSNTELVLPLIRDYKLNEACKK